MIWRGTTCFASAREREAIKRTRSEYAAEAEPLDTDPGTQLLSFLMPVQQTPVALMRPVTDRLAKLLIPSAFSSVLEPPGPLHRLPAKGSLMRPSADLAGQGNGYRIGVFSTTLSFGELRPHVSALMSYHAQGRNTHGR